MERAEGKVRSGLMGVEIRRFGDQAMTRNDNDDD